MLLQLVDSHVENRVLVSGRPPPEGRDLDLVVRPEEGRAIAARLREEGFLERGGQWALFRDCSVESLDLIPVDSLGLPVGEVSPLFDDAEPLDGCSQLVVPSAHHLLLLLARRVAAGEGNLEPRHRAQIERALERDPAAWARARDRARPWGATRALAALRAAHEEGETLSRSVRAEARAEGLAATGMSAPRARALAWREVLRPPSRPSNLVSFSGLDGAGKSTQAEVLRATLERLGFDTALVWSRFEWSTLFENRYLDLVSRPVKASLRVLERVRRTHRPEKEGGTPSPALPWEAAYDPAQSLRERSALVSNVWTTLVVLVHGAAQRRATKPLLQEGKFVICDRYTLDAAAYLRFRYGAARSFRFQIRLMQLISPSPVRAYFVDVPPEKAYGRRREEYGPEDLAQQAALYREVCEALGATRLDGLRPLGELCDEIAVDVWRNRY